MLYNPPPNFVIQTSAASGVTLKTPEILPSCQTGLWFYESILYFAFNMNFYCCFSFLLCI